MSEYSPTLLEMRAEIDRLNEELEKSKATHAFGLAEYKKRVAAKAREVAAERDWCNVGVRETLAELDIESPSIGTVEVRVHGSLRFDVDDDARFEDSGYSSVIDWIRACTNLDETRYAELTIGGDDAQVQINQIEFSVDGEVWA